MIALFIPAAVLRAGSQRAQHSKQSRRTEEMDIIPSSELHRFSRDVHRAAENAADGKFARYYPPSDGATRVLSVLRASPYRGSNAYGVGEPCVSQSFRDAVMQSAISAAGTKLPAACAVATGGPGDTGELFQLPGAAAARSTSMFQIVLCSVLCAATFVFGRAAIRRSAG
jgi:hypothetical protein